MCFYSWLLVVPYLLDVVLFCVYCSYYLIRYLLFCWGASVWFVVYLGVFGVSMPLKFGVVFVLCLFASVCLFFFLVFFGG